MPPIVHTKICVIGGGPAGSTVARCLAQRGHEVYLLEREDFPRPHIGESLSPGILPLLSFLGLQEIIENAGFYRTRQATVRWGTPEPSTKEYMGAPGFQVDRGRFDQILLKAAQEAGVTIWQPARATRPYQEGEKWYIPVLFNKKTFQITADFLVDATGRRSISGGKKKTTAASTLALYAYWKDVKMEGTESRVEAGTQEWFWGAPLPDSSFNAAVFLDSSRIHKARINKNQLSDFYFSLLQSSKLLNPCFEGTLITPVQACDATSFFSEKPVTQNSIKVGEAVFSIDPLSSQGVQAAIRSGIQAGSVVHTLLTKPQNQGLARKFYEEQIEETVSFHSSQSGRFYTEAANYYPSDFWQKRRSAEIQETKSFENTRINSLPIQFFIGKQMKLKLSPEVKIIARPCLVGDLIEEMPAILHKSLNRPVAFIKEVPVGFLLKLISSKKTIIEMLNESRGLYSPDTLLAIFNWMLSSNILTAADEF